MSMIEELKTLGVNADEGIARFMNNASLYEKMVKRFVDSDEKIKVMEFMESGDLETAKANAHNLKGVTGNLSLTPLYLGYSEIMTLLRNEQDEQAKEKLAEVLVVQKQIVDCIKKYL